MNKLFLYLKRNLKNEGPHGKYCGCSKWGHYAGMGCPNPTNKYLLPEESLKVNTKICK